jgi:hypothetical protein
MNQRGPISRASNRLRPCHLEPPSALPAAAFLDALDALPRVVLSFAIHHRTRSSVAAASSTDEWPAASSPVWIILCSLSLTLPHARVSTRTRKQHGAYAQVAQRAAVRRAAAVREEHARVDDAVVHHAERLEVVVERVAHEDRVRPDERAERLARRCEVQHGRREPLRRDAGEPADVSRLSEDCTCYVREGEGAHRVM